MNVMCPSCGCALSVPEGVLGKVARCKMCQHTFRIVVAAAPLGKPVNAAQPVDDHRDDEDSFSLAEPDSPVGPARLKHHAGKATKAKASSPASAKPKRADELIDEEEFERQLGGKKPPLAEDADDSSVVDAQIIQDPAAPEAALWQAIQADADLRDELAEGSEEDIPWEDRFLARLKGTVAKHASHWRQQAADQPIMWLRLSALAICLLLPLAWGVFPWYRTAGVLPKPPESFTDVRMEYWSGSTFAWRQSQSLGKFVTDRREYERSRHAASLPPQPSAAGEYLMLAGSIVAGLGSLLAMLLAVISLRDWSLGRTMVGCALTMLGMTLFVLGWQSVPRTGQAVMIFNTATNEQGLYRTAYLAGFLALSGFVMSLIFASRFGQPAPKRLWPFGT